VNVKELSLLRTYETGPKIWDAMTIIPTVYSLQNKGYIEPAPVDSLRYQLTEAGRKALADNQGIKT
jgi:DNA-binding PadR family transcriptional regulator